jgi:hypothetical protein
MTFGGRRDRLTRRGIADRHDPLKAGIWIHGKCKATAAWNNGNDRNQDVSVEIPGGRQWCSHPNESPKDSKPKSEK